MFLYVSVATGRERFHTVSIPLSLPFPLPFSYNFRNVFDRYRFRDRGRTVFVNVLFPFPSTFVFVSECFRGFSFVRGRPI